MRLRPLPLCALLLLTLAAPLACRDPGRGDAKSVAEPGAHPRGASSEPDGDPHGDDDRADPSKRRAQSPEAGKIECLATTNDGAAIELRLQWGDAQGATGTLTVGGEVTPVIAELYKGLTLVDAPGTASCTGKLATMTSEPTKTIRLGDYKQPTYDCR